MRRLAVFASILLTGFLAAWAGTGAIKGRVVDRENRQPITGALIVIQKIGKQAISDGEGWYALAGIPAGLYEIHVEHADYQPLVRTGIRVDDGQTTALDWNMEKVVQPLQEKVTVVGVLKSQKPEEPVSRFAFDITEISRIPSVAEDISRILNVLPSVARVNELSNDLIVRGGSPFENGFYIDNIPIFNVNYFQQEGGSGGVVGIINPEFIENSTFYSGAFPARYGDKLSSIIDIRFRDGKKGRFHKQVNLNASGFSLAAEGPWLKQKGTFHVSFRRSYLDLLSQVLGIGIAPRFGDFHGKLTWAPDDHNHIEFLAIAGDCGINYDLEKAVANGYNTYLQSKSRQWVTGLNWYHAWSARSDSETSLSLSGMVNWWQVYHLDSPTLYRALDEHETRFHLRHVTRFEAAPSLKCECGGDLQPLQSDYNNYYASHINNLGVTFPGLTYQGDFHSFKAGLFFSLTWKPVKALTLTMGSRGDYFAFNRRLQPSPRFHLSWAVSSAFSINAGIGFYHQNLYPLLLARNPEAWNLQDPSAFHCVAGIEFHPRENTVMTVELYDKEYRHFPLTPDDPGIFVIDNGAALTSYHSFSTIVNTGQAYARGLEFFLHHTITGRFYVIISASLFRSRYRDLEGVWRNRLYDNRFTLTVVGNFRPSKKWDLSLRWNFAGGPPYSPYDAKLSQEYGVGIGDPALINSARYPDFHSLSVRADRFFTFKNSRLAVYLNLNNLYNRKNVARYFWSIAEQKIAATYQLQLVPLFGIQYDF